MSIQLFEASRNEEFQDAITFWSNYNGDLVHDGKSITEDMLPAELLQAYNNLWSDSVGSDCYLAQTSAGYGVVLVNGYDREYGDYMGLSVNQLFQCAKKDAELLNEQDSFKDLDIYVAEDVCIDFSHEVIVFFPYDYPPKDFVNAAKKLYNTVYTSSVDLSQQQDTKIETYLRDQGIPHPDPNDISAWKDNGKWQKQYDECIENNYDIPDFDRWQLLQKILKVEISYDTAMKISSALENDGIDIMDLPNNFETLWNTEEKALHPSVESPALEEQPSADQLDPSLLSRKEDILDLVQNTIREGRFPEWENLCVEVPIDPENKSGPVVVVWGEEVDGSQYPDPRYFSVNIFDSPVDGIPLICSISSDSASIEDLSLALDDALIAFSYNEKSITAPQPKLKLEDQIRSAESRQSDPVFSNDSLSKNTER